MMREFMELETSEICTTLGISSSNCWVILHPRPHRAAQSVSRTPGLWEVEHAELSRSHEAVFGKRERKLSFREEISLRMHLMMCKGCANFRQQMGFGAAAARYRQGSIDPTTKDAG